MMKVVLKCGMCEKETLSSDLEGIFTIDFSKKIFEFQCPNCNGVNILDWNAISNNKKLPRVKMTKF